MRSWRLTRLLVLSCWSVSLSGCPFLHEADSFRCLGAKRKVSFPVFQRAQLAQHFPPPVPARGASPAFSLRAFVRDVTSRLTTGSGVHFLGSAPLGCPSSEGLCRPPSFRPSRSWFHDALACSRSFALTSASAVSGGTGRASSLGPAHIPCRSEVPGGPEAQAPGPGGPRPQTSKPVFGPEPQPPDPKTSPEAQQRPRSPAEKPGRGRGPGRATRASGARPRGAASNAGEMAVVCAGRQTSFEARLLFRRIVGNSFLPPEDWFARAMQWEESRRWVRFLWGLHKQQMETNHSMQDAVLPILAMNGDMPCAAAVYSDADAETNSLNTFILKRFIRNAGEQCSGAGTAILCHLIRNSQDRDGRFRPLRLAPFAALDPKLQRYYRSFGCTSLPKEELKPWQRMQFTADPIFHCNERDPDICTPLADGAVDPDVYFNGIDPEVFGELPPEMIYVSSEPDNETEEDATVAKGRRGRPRGHMFGGRGGRGREKPSDPEIREEVAEFMRRLFAGEDVSEFLREDEPSSETDVKGEGD